MNYAQLAFTETIKKIQEEVGSRNAYERMEKTSVVDGLTDNEINFISDMDSFYMASFGENSYPYIQHRGGPAGFIKVIDHKKIGIVDFAGNRQYISTGNISKNEKVALILISYPQRARLKLYAHAKIVDLKDNEELYNFLKPEEYKFRPERMIVFEIQAYDWNCPQHITPRYTAEQIEEALQPQKEYIISLENKIKELESKLSDK
ncbi:pyridoxamine 5'-phosphate oxidase family protein [Flavobacterium reichenbachii]|uniref:Pyridoxamine 5'-phosphate oxidase n=1 Tax=Flavobacterium reichenbachii TaxID=362418 RepID=A0A085ZES6_9FLAO|nr:pyridoxamine 5'-phosphate oxidase family protein [Flavobacterium reichenbachii]KFF02940.1 pyridoxamine 5'-phosphate oxidase [Flavobacterium reichenbachii]OXB16932.1 pyridoxamine 5'-phosphate oxidase [Flavobacterium reichenbachii]